MDQQADRAREFEEQQNRIEALMDDIRERIVVFSGKGGVGKTTVAVNLTFALALTGNKVGLLDADITGPDVPKMIGLKRSPRISTDEKIQPPVVAGVKVISFANMIPEDSPIIWRGPLRSRALDQFLADVDWGRLDYLVADLPPGTGDEVMTMAQHMRPHLAIVVTTPQEMSLIDCRRAVNMARKMGIPRVAIVENMAGLRCPECGCKIDLFGKNGGERMARDLEVPFLGRIPLHQQTREYADEGIPIVLADEDAEVSIAIRAIAEQLVSQPSL